MTKVTLDIISLIAFGTSLNSISNPDDVIPAAVTTILHETEVRVFSLLPFWQLRWWPATRRFNSAKQILVSEIRRIIKDRRSGDLEGSKDMLTRVLAEADSESGLTDEQLIDEGNSCNSGN
jgi:cytochrome P450